MAWIPAVIGAVASLWGSYSADKNQKKAAGAQGQITDLQKNAANQLMPWGPQFLQQGANATNTVLPYYTKLATGDRNSLLQTLAPELQQVGQNYDRPLNQLTETAPRSSASAASRMSMLSGRADALNRTMLGGRMAGVAGLAGMGSNLSQLGASTTGAAFGGLSGASNSNLGLLSSLFGIRQQNNADSEALGSSLAGFMRQYQTWNAGRSTGTGQPAAPTGGGSYWSGSGVTNP